MKQRWRHWWYGSVVNALKHYPGIKSDTSRMAQAHAKAIDAAIKETLEMDDGQLRIKAVDLIFFKRTCTVDGAALRVYASVRTVQRWTSAFIDLVGEKVGY